MSETAPDHAVPRLKSAPARPAFTPGRDGRRWSLVASAASIVSAFLASACCVGPLIFALLGLGGAGLLVKFEPYRPYLIALTSALLGAGFHVTYRRPKPVAMSGPACDCPAPRTNRIGKILLWIATALAVIMLAFPYVA